MHQLMTKYEKDAKDRCMIGFLFDKKLDNAEKPKYNKHFYEETDKKYFQNKYINNITPIPIEPINNNEIQILYNKIENENQWNEIAPEIKTAQERKEYLMSNLKLKNCTKEQIIEIEKICK